MGEDKVEYEWDGLDVPLDPGVTQELFREWRSPRFGKTNPERMSNPIWEWIIKSRMTAFAINEQLKGPDVFEAGPGWCFKRFGRSSTHLADGRVVLIAGEHEDSYDPNFCIYNDVVVKHPDGRFDIFGYPRELFGPTDFHSATLVGERIIIIGNLSYPEERKPGLTPVIALDLATFAIEAVQTSGEPPGWIYQHTATLSEDGSSIVVRGGEVEQGDHFALSENIDDWRLNLAHWRWERLTQRPWQQWLARRVDGRPIHLWEMINPEFLQSMLSQEEEKMKLLIRIQQQADPEFAWFEKGKSQRPNVELLERLYRPSIKHEELPTVEGEYDIHRVKVGGVVLKYVQSIHSIHLRVEGELPQATIEVITRELAENLAILENAPCELVRL